MTVCMCTACGTKREDDFREISLEESGQQPTAQESEQKKSGASDTGQTEDDSREKQQKTADGAKEKETVPETVFVYVCGEVRQPGVYELKAGARVYEVLQLAGGLKESAAVSAVNQAMVLSDGEQIYIPTEEEWQSGSFKYPMQNDSQRNSVPQGSDAAGKIDINRATAEELKTLKGIGATRAESIVSYRETNGPFQSIEDLMKVDGIKEGVFAGIRDSIIVNAGS